MGVNGTSLLGLMVHRWSHWYFSAGVSGASLLRINGISPRGGGEISGTTAEEQWGFFVGGCHTSLLGEGGVTGTTLFWGRVVPLCYGVSGAS